MPKLLGTRCTPKKWIVSQIINNDLNCWCTDGRYLILNHKIASKYWKLQNESFIESQGSEESNNKHYITIGTDGDVCIKSYFFKSSGISNVIVADDDIQSLSQTDDWRQCSVWLTNYNLKLMKPLNSTKPEIVLFIKSCYIINNSDCLPIDYEPGFMSYCMENAEVKFKLKQFENSLGKESEDDEVICLEDEEEIGNLSLLINLLDNYCSSTSVQQSSSVNSTNKRKKKRLLKKFETENDDQSVNEVNISTPTESDDDDDSLLLRSQKKFKSDPPPLISNLWKNADKDFPSSWLNNSRFTETDSPRTNFDVKNSSNEEFNQALNDSDEPIIIEDYPSSSSAAKVVEEYVYVRSVRTQTDCFVTGWSNDQVKVKTPETELFTIVKPCAKRISSENNVTSTSEKASSSHHISSDLRTKPPGNFRLSNDLRKQCIQILFD